MELEREHQPETGASILNQSTNMEQEHHYETVGINMENTLEHQHGTRARASARTGASILNQSIYMEQKQHWPGKSIWNWGIEVKLDHQHGTCPSIWNRGINIENTMDHQYETEAT